MILNTYAVLDGFVALLRLGLGLFVLALGVAAWRAWRRRTGLPEDQKGMEDRSYLLFLLGGLLLILNVLSWPIFYLLLQSYVPEWPNVMCIYGVTRIGTGSINSARFLPPLVEAVQFAKPALVFASGAWFVLYLVNRRTRMAPLTGRIILVLVVAGLLAVGDAAAEVTYLAIPKKEVFLSGGCCTAALDASQANRLLPAALVGEGQTAPWYVAYYGINGLVALAADLLARLCRRRLPRLGLLALFLGVVAAVAISAVFLVEVAAPRLLHLPYHHCPYDLIPRAPESLLAVALFFASSFAVGWACIAAWVGRAPETTSLLPTTVGRLLYLASFGYLLSLVMMSVMLAIA